MVGGGAALRLSPDPAAAGPLPHRHPADTRPSPAGTEATLNRHPVDTPPIPCRYPVDTLPTPCRYPVGTLSVPCRYPTNTSPISGRCVTDIRPVPRLYTPPPHGYPAMTPPRPDRSSPHRRRTAIATGSDKNSQGASALAVHASYGGSVTEGRRSPRRGCTCSRGPRA